MTLTDSGYYIGDGQGKRPGGGTHLHGPGTTVADFNRLTPMVVMQALAEAGTVVCEPFARVRLEVPAMSLATVLSALAKLGGRFAARSTSANWSSSRRRSPPCASTTCSASFQG